MSVGALKLRRGDDAEAGDFGDGEGAVDGGGDFGLRAAGEGEGEQAALEFGFGLRGESGHRSAHIGEDDGLAEERHGCGGGAARDEEGVAFVDHVGPDGDGDSRRGCGTGGTLHGGLLRSAWGGFGCQRWLHRRCFLRRGGRDVRWSEAGATRGEAGHHAAGNNEILAWHIMESIMSRMSKPAARMWQTGAALSVLLLGGCDLLTVSQTGRNVREGNEAMVRGEVQRALQHYEAALDGTMLSAEAHYRLGLLYEDQLKNEVGALHHFERYLELAPQGQFSTDVKAYVERLRLTIVSRLADGPVMPAREAARLKNENLALRQQVTEMRQQAPSGRAATPVAAAPAPVAKPVATPAMIVAATPPPQPSSAPGEPEVRRAVPVGAAVPIAATDGDTARVTPINPAAPTAPAADAPVRTYQVASGDTLAGIARRFYKNSGQWPKIAEANKATLEDPTKLKVGMVLVIPE